MARLRAVLAEAPLTFAAGILGGLAFWGVDVLSWTSARGGRALVTSATLFVAAGAAMNLVVVPVMWLPARMSKRLRSGRLAPLALVALALVLLALDQTVLVSLYESAHAFAEGLAFTALTFGIAPLLSFVAQRNAFARGWFRALAAVSFVWLAVFVSSISVRRIVEGSLPSVWEEPVYAARWLRRVHRAEAVLLYGTRTEHQRLSAKYDVPEAILDESWHAHPGARREGESSPPWNVVVFFVDALRADVAHDPAVMPQTVDWMQRSAWFSRTYASGSSTILTLAPLFGCRVDSAPSGPATLLDAARSAGMQTALFIPRSADEYHRVFFPGFRFDKREIVSDLERGRIPTANEIVDRSLAWLEDERPSRFFLWLYQFDVHSWGDLDAAYLDERATSANLSRTEGLPWRYRAAARGVDEAFERLRAGLESLGLAERTVVVFLSDHGEALGQQSFWGHSTYLWESLLRVPLAVHVPGHPARRSDAPVSTIDLATTLTRFVGPLPHDAACHGEDLLEEVTDRRLPILFSAMIDGQVARIGLLGAPDRKLVVDLRNAEARLLKIEDATSIEEDVSSADVAELVLRLHQIVRSPIYPRW